MTVKKVFICSKFGHNIVCRSNSFFVHLDFWCCLETAQRPRDFSSAGSKFLQARARPFSTALRIPDSGFQETEFVFLVCLFVCLFVLRNPKSWALRSRIQLKDSGIPLSIGIREPLSQEPITNELLKLSGIRRIHRMESGIHDCLGFNRTWGSVYSKNLRTMC